MRTLVVLLFQLVALTILAQSRPNFGLGGGISVADQVWDTGEDIQVTYLRPRIGAYVNANMEFYHEDMLSLYTEVAFVQKGTRLEWSVTDADHPVNSLGLITEDYNLNYLHWFAAVKFKADWEQLQPYVLLGPRIDIQLSLVRDFALSGVESSTVLFGATAGVGFQYKPRKRNFVIFMHGLYLPDFMDIHYTNGGDLGTSLTIRNTVFVISAGVQTHIIFDR